MSSWSVRRSLAAGVGAPDYVCYWKLVPGLLESGWHNETAKSSICPHEFCDVVGDCWRALLRWGSTHPATVHRRGRLTEGAHCDFRGYRVIINTAPATYDDIQVTVPNHQASMQLPVAFFAAPLCANTGILFLRTRFSAL